MGSYHKDAEDKLTNTIIKMEKIGGFFSYKKLKD
jgi:hypothetical protein